MKEKIYFGVLVCLVWTFCFAMPTAGAETRIPPVIDVPSASAPIEMPKDTDGDVASYQAKNWIVSAHFSYLDLLLPGKYGVAVTRADSENSAIELEYTHGSLSPFFVSDLGSFSEDRISLTQRGGKKKLTGFQWYYGVFYQRMKLDIGNALLNRLTTYYPSATLISISGLGGMLGVGYRWLVSESIVVGVDAIAYSQPLYTLTRDTEFLNAVTNSSDREKIETAITAMQYFPRLTIAKVMIGYSF